MPFLTKLGHAFLVFLTATAIDLPAQNDLVSMPMEVAHAKPYVQVMVNGRGPFRFIVDTGTGGEALISPELADRLALPSAGIALLTDPTGQGERRTPMVQIDSLQIGAVEFTAVKAVRHNIASGDGTCMGALGFTLFRDYLLTLDYPNRKMTLARGALALGGDGAILPFRMPEGVPIATLHIGELQVEAQFDSGGAGLSLPERLAPRLKFLKGPEIFGKGESLSTRFQVKAAKLAADVQLGPYTFAQPFVEINPAFPLANFGSVPMQNFAITFDQQKLLMRLSADRKMIQLGTTPTPIRMESQPEQKPPAQGLVPVG